MRTTTKAPKTTRRPAPKPLPCPFCGGIAKVRQEKASPPELTKGWWAVGCDLNNECTAWPSVISDTRSEAITAWNRRTTTSTKSIQPKNPRTIHEAWIAMQKPPRAEICDVPPPQAFIDGWRSCENYLSKLAS